ncbi:bifunctional lysylphosphatidylglycerol flippase/synthetase MprF [Desulfobacter curvatus]|uniref:bifunctional lysylphosphatidylglycerol flippase/synthetase MprF n=1 Tax=Desulfobacter curvatus TaxID=2290 RepID=UPI000362B524|nr:bifunctional lysylphosphatidylglycerol flippase/synthetase MprF [Desulfobacter curvatus]
MKNTIKSLLGLTLSLALFAGAAFLMHRELSVYHFKDVIATLRSIPLGIRVSVFFLTVISYGVLTGYDTLGLKHIHKKVPYPKIALASFTGYAFSNNIGLSMIAGASVRYRLYSAWGLSSFDIAKVIGFCAVTTWLGFSFLNGLALVVNPGLLGAAVHVSPWLIRVLGLCLITIVSAYLAFSLGGKKVFSFRGHEIRVPDRFIAFSQIVLGVLDWTLAGMVLYLLLSHFGDLSLPGFLTVFLVSQLVALFSQVPGGLGVFESLMVLSLSAQIPAPHILGALIAFRVIYYWIPLGIAALLLGGQELLRGKKHTTKLMALFDRWVSPIIPSVFGFTVLIGGAILLFSGATPALGSRVEQLKAFFSLPFIEVSHFLGSIAGMGLLLLGRGLQRRLDAAYMLSVILLFLGIAASLVKGFDYEEAAALTVILAALLPSRRHFYRKASLFSQKFSPGWTTALLIILMSSTWLGFYAYRHVEYADALWWQFTFKGNAARFMRATLGVSVMGLFFALARLMRPGVPNARFPNDDELKNDILPIVRRSESATANLALLGDKRINMNQNKDAFIMYGIEGKSWVSMGDPVGPVATWPDLIWRFRELADQAGGWPVFYQISHERLHIYLDMGFTMVKLGEEARVPLETFTIGGHARKNLRSCKNKFEKTGYVFSVLEPEQVYLRMEELKAVSDAWIEKKSGREKGFSLGFFSPEYLSMNPVAVVEKDGKIEAFANLWQSAGKHELSVDLMRFTPGSPNGIMDYLFTAIILWSKEAGYAWFNLGMAPFSGIEASHVAPFWNRLGAFVFNHGETVYNFHGLRQYKEKFDPVWSPRYLAAPGGLAMPVVFTNLASLISGGVKGLLLH